MSTANARLEALRSAFDEQFALPVAEQAGVQTRLILLDLGEERFALRLTALAGFEPLRKCVPLAGAAPGVVGVAGVRGRLLPVFDLAHALGLRHGDAPRWLALVGRDAHAAAFAFGSFRGQVQVPEDRIRPVPDSLRRTHLPQRVTLDQRPVGVIDVDSLGAALHPASHARGPASRTWS